MRLSKLGVILLFSGVAACNSRPPYARHDANFASLCGGGAQARIVYDPDPDIDAVTEVDQEGLISQDHSEKVESEPPTFPVGPSDYMRSQFVIGGRWRCMFTGLDTLTTVETQCEAITEDARREMPTCSARMSVRELRPGSRPGSFLTQDIITRPGGRDLEDLFDDSGAVSGKVSDVTPQASQGNAPST